MDEEIMDEKIKFLNTIVMRIIDRAKYGVLIDLEQRKLYSFYNTGVKIQSVIDMINKKRSSEKQIKITAVQIRKLLFSKIVKRNIDEAVSVWSNTDFFSMVYDEQETLEDLFSSKNFDGNVVNDYIKMVLNYVEYFENHIVVDLDPNNSNSIVQFIERLIEQTPELIGEVSGS